MDIIQLGKNWLCSIQRISAEMLNVEKKLSVATVLIFILLPKHLKTSLII